MNNPVCGGANVDWNQYWAEHEAPQEKDQKEARIQYSKSLWIHEDAELGRKLGPCTTAGQQLRRSTS